MTDAPNAPAAPAAPRAPLGRIDGLDLARFAALIGMMCAHTWLYLDDQSTPLVTQIISGKAAALFAVLAGVGIAITTRGVVDGTASIARARWSLVGRGVALLLIGLTLGLISPLIMVILAYYGVMFWLCIPALRWSPRVLLAVAAAWSIAWPFASLLVRRMLGGEPWFASPSWLSFENPLALVTDLLLTGGYPALIWLPYPLLGMAIGRWLLRARSGPEPERRLRAFALRLLLIGSAVAALAYGAAKLLAVAVGARGLAGDLGIGVDEALRLLDSGAEIGTPTDSLWRLLTTAGHSGTPPDLLITGGIAAAAIGAGLLLGMRLAPSARRWLAPVLGAGSAPLTVYTVHVIAVFPGAAAFMLTEPDGIEWWFSSFWLWLAHITLALGVGMLVRLTRERGPLERLVTAFGRWFGRLGGPDAAERP